MKEISLIPAEIIVPAGRHLCEARSFQGIPSITRTAGGRLLACWYSGGDDEGPENFVLIAYSDDQGESWSDAAAVAEPAADQVRAFDPSIFTAPNGEVVLFWAQSFATEAQKMIDVRCGVFLAKLLNPDAPPETWQWTSPRRIADGLMLNKPTILKNGSAALPISVCRNNFFGEEEVVANSGTKMYTSDAEFQDFTEQGKCLMPLEDASFDEHSFIEKNDGTLWVVIRSKFGNHESFSVDGGKNWSEPQKSAISGPCSRLHITRLKSGKLLLINNVLPPGEYCRIRKDLTAMLSDDDGKTWYGNLLLDGREGVSYPDAIEGDDGFIYAVYDHQRYLCGDVLMARFSEADIAAGKVVTPGSKLQMLISSTGGVKQNNEAEKKD